MRINDPTAESTAMTVIRISKDIICISLGILALFFALTKGYSFGKSLFYVDPAEEAPGTDVEITISDEETYETLGQYLYEEGIITNTLSFVVQSTLYEINLYPGTYTVNTSQTIREMLLDIDEAADALSEEALSLAAAADDDEVAGGYEGDDTEDGSILTSDEAAYDEDTARDLADGTEGTLEVIGGGSESD